MFVMLAAVVVALEGVFMVGQRSASAHDHLIQRTVLVKREGDVFTAPSRSPSVAYWRPVYSKM